MPGTDSSFTAAQAARLTRCTPARLDTWRRIGLVEPASTGGYGFRDLVALRMVASLLEDGVAMGRIRRAVGELLACRDDGQVLDALRHGQLVLFVSVARLAGEVEAEVRAFDAERRAFVAGLRDVSAAPSGHSEA